MALPVSGIGVRGGRSVRWRLLAALVGVASLTVLAAAVAGWALLRVGGVVDRVTGERAPSAVASLALSRQAERFVTAAPSLLRATTEPARARAFAAIGSQLQQLQALLAELEARTADRSALERIEPAVQGLARNLEALDWVVAERLDLARARQELQRQLANAIIAMQRLVAPGILVLDSQLATWRNQGAAPEAAGPLAAAMAGFVPLQKAQLEIAAINDGLARAAEAPTLAELPLLSFPLKRSLVALDGLGPDLEPRLRERFDERVKQLLSLSEGLTSLPAARERELLSLARGELLLDENARLSATLTAEVDRLVAAARRDIEAAATETTAVQRTSGEVLALVVLLSLLSSGLIVWLYVDRRLVRRLQALAESMLKIAGGELQTPLPAKGGDEIGRMAEALAFFRDTAVEVEGQRLRERQVVLDTIDYGVLILDADLTTRIHNAAFRRLSGLAEPFLAAKPSYTAMMEAVRQRGDLYAVADERWPAYAAARLEAVRAGTIAPHEWQLQDGRILEMQCVPLPDGGRLLTYFDLTRLKRAEAGLRAAKEQAEQANHAKSAFLASMSHELRTPLNAIIGFTRLVMRRAKEALPQRQYENLEKILLSAEHLLSLINSILDLSKIEAGRMEVKVRAFELSPLLDVCLDTVRPLVRSQSVALVKDAALLLPTMVTDEEKLRQILINLLSNAAKFTEAGTITLRARVVAGEVTIAVVDTGIGIPADKLETIFEEFRQVEDTTVRVQAGTGLGLSISRRLARLLGGDVTVRSEAGQGSTFELTLPLAAGEPEPAVPPEPRATPRRMEGSRVVLAVDDDPNVIYLLKENLADAGYRVEGVTSPEEAVKKAKELKPRAITLDIVMPGSDGWQVLYALKSDPATRDIPVILLSVVDQKDLGFRLGAADYLLKPIDREALLHTLERVAPRCRRLLAVDDDPDVPHLLGQLLEGVGTHLETARNGEEALTAMRAARPDCVLLDLLMPVMDGFALLDAMHSDPALASIPVVVLTAKDLLAGERQALQSRVRGIIEKHGLERDGLLREIRKVLAEAPG